MKRHGRKARIGDVTLDLSRIESGRWQLCTTDPGGGRVYETHPTKRAASHAFSFAKWLERRWRSHRYNVWPPVPRRRRT